MSKLIVVYYPYTLKVTRVDYRGITYFRIQYPDKVLWSIEEDDLEARVKNPDFAQKLEDAYQKTDKRKA